MKNHPKTESLQVTFARPIARNACFGLLLVLSLGFLRLPLLNLVHLAVQDYRYTYVLAVPVISVYLAWLRGNKCLSNGFRYCPGVGVPLLVAGTILFYSIGRSDSALDPDGSLSLAILAVILLWVGVFVLCYGTHAFRSALAPALFLLLLIPLPSSIMDRAVLFLQQGSAEMTQWLFTLMGVPFLRDGFRFALPGIEIEIAEECSGIRSSTSLLLCSILAGYLFLQSSWRRLCFVLATVPIVIFKNALRIVIISWLGLHVDSGFFYGSLHHRGGVVFAVPGFLLMTLSLWILRKSETVPEMSISKPISQYSAPSEAAPSSQNDSL